MARPIRVEFEGAVYHVTARGNERRAIFRDEKDRERFVETLGECAERFDVMVHVYCLMANHYHLAVETPQGNLSRAVGWLQTAYSIRFNRRHRRSGHLFQGRFKAHLVDADAYAKRLVLYVHLNSVRVGLPRRKTAATGSRTIPVERRASLRQYRHSSHRAYLGLCRSPDWLSTRWLLYWGRRRGDAQRRYGHEIAACFGKAVANPFEDLRDGLVLGGDSLQRRVRTLIGQSKGQEELRWRRRWDGRDARRRLMRLATAEEDKRVRIWMRARLGGERMTEIAADQGYADGSGVLRVVQRLERQAKRDRSLARHMAHLASQIRERR